MPIAAINPTSSADSPARLAHFAVRSEITRLLVFHGLTTLVICAAITRAVLVPGATKFPVKWFACYLPVLAYVALMLALRAGSTAATEAFPPGFG